MKTFNIAYDTKSSSLKKNVSIIFLTMVLVLQVIIGALVFFNQSHYLATLIVTKNELRAQIDEYFQLKSKQTLLEKQEIALKEHIAVLQNSSYEKPLILKIAEIVPAHIRLQTYNYERDFIQFTGYSKSLASLHLFMYTLKEIAPSLHFRLLKTKQEELNNKKMYVFTVTGQSKEKLNL